MLWCRPLSFGWSLGGLSAPPLLLRLADRHFDPLKQTPASAIFAAVRAAQQTDASHLELTGGGGGTSDGYSESRCPRCSGNELWDLRDQILALQKQGFSERAQRMRSRVAQQKWHSDDLGSPYPLQKTVRNFWHLAKGAVSRVCWPALLTTKPTYDT